MKKVLITGGSGLIGSEVINLLKDSHLVFSISRSKMDKLQENVKSIFCDLSKDFDTTVFPKKIDSVIHLAQSEHFREFPEKARDVFYVNTLSTLKLLEYARSAGAKTFIYASSGGVYGYGVKGFKEDYPIVAKRDLGFYLGTKLSSEIIADNYMPYMNVIILRFFFVYGPRQKSSMLIPRLIKNVKEGIPIILHGKDGIRINPIYVLDAARAVVQSLNLNDSQKINVGGAEILSMREIGVIIGEVMNKKPEFEIVDAVEPRDLIGNTEKMTQLLMQHTVSFREGIQRMVM